MANITLNSDLLTLNMQNSVWEAPFMISAGIWVEIMVVRFSSDEKNTSSLDTSTYTLNMCVCILNKWWGHLNYQLKW